MPPSGLSFWLRLYVVAAALYALMASSAQALGSVRGEAGLIVGALVLAATLALDRLLISSSIVKSWRQLGLGTPVAHGLIVAAFVCAALVALLPLAAVATGLSLSLRGDWYWLVPGLLAQAGLAEELVFRGFVYGRIRSTLGYWRATLLSIAPFAVVHLALFLTLPWPIATASLVLAIAMCPPLTHLYELAGRTIWAPALLHAVVQGAIKVLDFSGDSAFLLPLIWIGACAVLPYVVFIWRRPTESAPTLV